MPSPAPGPNILSIWLGPTERMAARVLSRNPVTGQQTLLLRLDPGYGQNGPGSHSAWLQAFVLQGAVRLGKFELGPGGFVHRPAGTIDGPLASQSGALLYIKLDGRLDYALA